jgi:hypothetical protein
MTAADPCVLNGLVTRWPVGPWTTVVGPAAANPAEVPPTPPIVPPARTA